MKTNYIWQILFAVTIYIVASVPTKAYAQQETVYVKSTNLTEPLFKIWVEEYSKNNPETNIKLADKNTQDEIIQINIADNTEDFSTKSQVILPVARYAILPISNKENPLLGEVKDKRIDKDKLTKIFFERDIDDEGKYPYKNKVTVYSGSKNTSNSVVVSGYFEKTQDEFTGKKIAGDDIYLINAVSRDQSGAAFNYLSYIYDLETRQLKENIALLPIDVKKDQWQAISSNIDEALSLLESQKVNLVPIETLSLSFDKNLPTEALSFIEWIVTDGQKLNHQYGFLNIDSKQQANIQKQIDYYANLISTNNK